MPGAWRRNRGFLTAEVGQLGLPLRSGGKDDLENAGATWVDEPVVVDKNLISSRTPADLAPFAKAMVQFLDGDVKARTPQRAAPAATRPAERSSMTLKKAMFRDVLK